MKMTMNKNRISDIWMEHSTASKRLYVKPLIAAHHYISEGSLLANTPNTRNTWTADDSNGANSPTIVIKDEEDSNLGEEGSEVTGAKSHTAWNTWD